MARGSAEKAVVLASRAVKERPDHLTARSLYERARRELLRGRRRERLEARVGEARALLGRGEHDAAERIVSSALKIVPDHAEALRLFSQLRERRLSEGTAEAEAERELLRLGQAQAKKALVEARVAFKAGWERKTLLAIRRGLRLVPDDADLLSLLREVQPSLERPHAERSEKRARETQIRAGLDLLAQSRLDESRSVLRAVLREDPDNGRAQAAIQELRRAWLQRASVVVPPSIPSVPQSAPAPPTPVRPATAVARPTPVSSIRVVAPLEAPSVAPAAAVRDRRIPAEILLPRPRRRGTPWTIVLGAAALLAVLVAVVVGRAPEPRRPSPAATGPVAAPPSTPPAPRSPEPPGPLTGLDPELRGVIESTLEAYASALEAADAEALSRARPDLSPAARERILAPFRGALNAATDLRVLDVVRRQNEVVVPVLRTDVIVGGSAPGTPPVEETLRFERRGERWVLR